eukprot:TRINITY_DN6763_c0_g1_i1.p1 TRINITY_DN6763_c0_g1~~TRINITY_DN6763_c0_g1_i1.p1  ORF type:complete len:213 (+),score=26.84 TRINITY_DN6763_c0_g1_i1:104-742(+)
MMKGLSLICTCLTIFLFLSPWKTIQEIQDKKSTGSFTSSPYVAMIINCAFWLGYGYLVQNFTILLVNTVGLLCGLYYTFIFYLNADDKTFVQRQVLSVLLLSMVIMGYLVGYLPREDMALNLGLIASIFSILLFGSPLFKLGKMIKSKNSDGLDPRLTVCSLLSCLAWSLYGLLLNDSNIIVPNSVGFVLSCVQAAVLVVYSKPYQSVILEP